MLELQIPARTEQGARTICPGLTMEWLGGGSIVVFTLTTPSREVIDTYFKINWLLMDEADEQPDRLMLMLHDVAHKNMSLTPMLRERLNTIAKRIKTGKVHYRAAIVMADSVLARVFMFFGDLFTNQAQNTIQKFFVDRAKAVQWLEQYGEKGR